MTVLLPRDAMRKRGLCCRSVPVRLSEVHCSQTAEDIYIFLSGPGSHIILVEPPSAGAQNTRGVKCLRFLIEIAVHLENNTR